MSRTCSRAHADDVGVVVLKPLGGCLLAAHADLALRWVLQTACVAIPGMWRRWSGERDGGDLRAAYR